MSPTPPPTPPTMPLKSSVSKPQKRVKTYLTIDDLHRMFAGKLSRACLPIIQKITFSSSSSPQFMSHKHLKSVFKFTTQMRTSSIQMRITSYFKSTREKTEKMVSLALKSGLIFQPSRREMRANMTFKCALKVSKKMPLSPHTLSPSLYCRLKRSSPRLRCMSN